MRSWLRLTVQLFDNLKRQDAREDGGIPSLPRNCERACRNGRPSVCRQRQEFSQRLRQQDAHSH